MSGISGTEPTLEGLVVATMFRGDRTQLLQWCNIHLNAGADRLYIVLDRPTTELVDGLPDEPRIQWEVIDQEAWDRFYPRGRDNVERKQVDAVRWVMRRAAAEGHRYLAFVDTDEVLDLSLPLTDLAARYEHASALRVPSREMWFDGPERVHEPFGATLALRPASRGVAWSRALGWRAQYLQNGMLGHDAGKTIYRLPVASGAFSVHGPVSGPLRSGAVTLSYDEGQLLHYDCGSVATWNAKWAARFSGGTVAAALWPHRRAQQLLFGRELRRSPQLQEQFFARFFSLDTSSAGLLAAAGLLARVEVTPLVAGPLENGATHPDGADSHASPTLTRLPDPDDRVDYQFALVCDQNFVKPTFATMISVLAQAGTDKSVRFVVLGDGLGPADERRLRLLQSIAPNVEVRVHDVTAELDRDLGREGHKRARATYARVYLVDFLPEQRTVYLDGDVLATRDISELFDLPMGDACIAGVPDSAALRFASDPSTVPVEQRMRLTGVAGEDPLEYVNAGVLVLDLDHPDFRELALRSRAHVSMEGRVLAQHDQDAINLAFTGRKHRLPSTYNYMTQLYTSERCVDADLVSLKYAAADASLIHFSGKVKPWVSREDEFYNGLYRRLVLAAEEKVGVSCEFYFSRPARPGCRRSAEEWGEIVASTLVRRPVEITPRTGDIELIDVTDEALYLRVEPDTYELAMSRRLRIVARTGDRTLFEVGLDRLSPQQTHLSQRVASGVRVLPVDLPAALADHGGIARHVELVVAPSDDADGGFERPLAMIDALAAGSAARSGVLAEMGVDGRVEELADGSLNGWYESAAGVPVSLHIAGELVSRRTPQRQEDGRRRFKFRVGHLVSLGYGSPGATVSVRLAGSNIPLPGETPTVADVRAASTSAARAPTAGTGRALLGAVRRRLRER